MTDITGLGCYGCLGLIVGFLIFAILLKFWFVLALIILIIVLLVKKPAIITQAKAAFGNKSEYTSKPGVVYKECAFCHRKSDRKANFCDNCGKPFDEY